MRLNPNFESMLLEMNDEPRGLDTLYHGTTRPRARRVLAEGLLPRSATGVATLQEATGSPWAASEQGCVFLHRIQAPIYAISVAMAQGGAPAVVEMAVAEAARERLLPDIDLVAMGMVLAKGDDVGEREFRAARESLREHRAYWPASLAILDGVAHDGPMVGAARRAWSIDLSPEQTELVHLVWRGAMAFDCATTGACVLGPAERAFHEGLTAWATGERVRPRDLLPDWGTMPRSFRARLEAIFDRRWAAVRAPAPRAAERRVPQGGGR